MIEGACGVSAIRVAFPYLEWLVALKFGGARAWGNGGRGGD